MTNTELDIAVKKFGLQTVTMLTTALKSVGADNTGDLIRSIRAELVETAKGLELMINGKGYFDVVDKGRLPGKQPPLSDILEWVKSKGLPEGAAFPIAKNIGKFGIKPRPVLQQVINSNSFKDNYKIIGEAYAKDVVTEINKLTKEI